MFTLREYHKIMGIIMDTIKSFVKISKFYIFILFSRIKCTYIDDKPRTYIQAIRIYPHTICRPTLFRSLLSVLPLFFTFCLQYCTYLAVSTLIEIVYIAMRTVAEKDNMVCRTNIPNAAPNMHRSARTFIT